MKKAITIILILMSVFIVCFSAVGAFSVKQSTEATELTDYNFSQLDVELKLIKDGKLASFDRANFDNIPLFVFVGDYNLADLEKYEIYANVALIKSSENYVNTIYGIAYHLNQIETTVPYIFNEIRLLIKDKEIMSHMNLLVDTIEEKIYNTKILPDRIAYFNDIIIDKNENSVYNNFDNIFKRLNKMGSLVEFYDLTANQHHLKMEYAVTLFAKDQPFDYYTKLLNEDLPIDFTVNNSSCYGLSPKLPLIQLYARMGERYFYEEDKQTSTIKDSYIVGYVFLDRDNNGYYDTNWDIIKENVNIKVKLYLKGTTKLLSFGNSDSLGRYRIKVPKIYANSFDKILVETEKNEHLPTSKNLEMPFLSNQINRDYRSDLFSINSPIELKILNIGYLK